jgi:hypothetical protein
MRIIKIIGFVLIIVFSSYLAQSQDTLPKFSARLLDKNMVQISWNNNFKNLAQLTVQRSLDSTKYFKSIFSSESPQLPQNGFIDKKAPVGFKVYYRILYVFEGGEYFFTKSKQSFKFINENISSNNPKQISKNSQQEILIPITQPQTIIPELLKTEKSLISIYKKTRDSIINKIELSQLKKFKDSIAKFTKDTLQINTATNEIFIKPFVAKPVWKPSVYLFTNEKDFIQLLLPLAKQMNYKILFFDELGKSIFQIEQLKEIDLIIDKSNFRKAGWVFFELYENDKLKEKNKFYLSVD